MATLNVPRQVPSPAEDAEALRKACQGWGTDEKAVIRILAHRDASQRKQIMQAYELLYKENLIKRLESELSGDFEKAVYRWMFDPVERQAILAHITEKKGVDHRTIIEIACINSTTQLLAVKQAYQARYKHSLEEDVASHTTGDFRKLLLALIGTYRYEGEDINVSLAQSEAKILHEAIKEKAFNHEEIIRILGTRSKAQLIATFNRYKDDYGTSITKNVTTETPSELVSALRVAIRCIASPLKYYEKVLRNATNKETDEDTLTRKATNKETDEGTLTPVIVAHADINKETDEDTLTRVVVGRAEKDLLDIKEKYEKRNNTTLAHAVGKATSGDYKEFLLALIGN